MIKYILIFVFVFINLNLWAQETVLVVDKSTYYSLWDGVTLYWPEDKSLGIDDILKKRSAFSEMEKAGYECYFDKDVWLRVQVSNKSESVFHWVAILGIFRKGDVYTTDSEGRFHKMTVGSNIPLRKHNMPQTYFNTQVSLYFPTNELTEVFIHLKCQEDEKIYFSPYVFPKEVWYDQEMRVNLIQGIFFGFFLIMILYHLLLYRSVRDKSYLGFVLYLFFIVVTFSIPFSFVWPHFKGEYYIYVEYFLYFLQVMPLVAYFYFLRVFVKTKENIPFWDKIIQGGQWFMILSAVASCLDYYIHKSFFESFVYVNVAMIIVIVLTFVLLVFIYRIKNIISRYFVFGTALLAVFALAGLVLIQLNMYYQHLPQYTIEAGMVLQILVFAIGLGKKMRITEEERKKAQDQLIQELIKNQALQQKVNLELEQKVKERTHLIEEQKESLIQQKEELQASNELLEERNSEIALQKSLLEKSHHEITDSINYASKIQNAVLPRSEEVQKFLSEYFIVYRPSNIVSGDFYYIKQIGEKIIVVAADCTGHGVPGAFMSMLSITLLNELIGDNESITSAQILERLRTQIKTSLRQTGKRGEPQDGIDMAICCIDKCTMELNYAGAYNPLVLFRPTADKQMELHEVKANKQPVGIFIKETPFTDHYVQLQENDMFYVFSDGYYSQFGGERQTSYKSKRFKQFLGSIAHFPVAKQKQLLEKEFEDWKGETSQVDDVIVIGVSVNRAISF